LVNLLTNGIKYSPVNEKIIIDSYSVSSNFEKIVVTDHGEGIPAGHIDKIFFFLFP
jgi:signal transduction histidine kinase